MGEMWNGGVGGVWERGSLVILPVHMPFLCTSLAVVKCVCEGTLVNV